MDYKVIVTSDAEKDLDQYIQYLLFEKKNVQAAQNVLNDFEATKKSLEHVAKADCECPLYESRLFFSGRRLLAAGTK